MHLICHFAICHFLRVTTNIEDLVSLFPSQFSPYYFPFLSGKNAMHFTLGLVVIPFISFSKYRGAMAYSWNLSDYSFLCMNYKVSISICVVDQILKFDSHSIFFLTKILCSLEFLVDQLR